MGVVWTFLLYLFSSFSPSLWETARYRLKYCLKGQLNSKSTNQPSMLNSAEHEILATYKQQITDDYSCYSCLVQLIMKFSLLMNMKIPTLVAGPRSAIGRAPDS